MSHVSYVTFDGAALKFDGTCRYVLSAVTNEYRVLVQNGQLKPLRRAPMAFTKEVIVEFGKYTFRNEWSYLITVQYLLREYELQITPYIYPSYALT